MWAARDLCNNICLFTEKPYYYEKGRRWLGNTTGTIFLSTKTTLSELTFENSPQEVELKIKEK